MLGSAATSLAVLAVAVIGFLFLNGQLDWKRVGRVVIGCFLIFGAPILSAGLLENIGDPPVQSQKEARMEVDLPPPVPRSNERFDPYAGAAVQRGW